MTPGYAIYEEGVLSKVALINYMDDNGTGTNALQVTIQLSSGVPQSVQVKYVYFFTFLGFFFWRLVDFSFFLDICLLVLFRLDSILHGLVR